MLGFLFSVPVSSPERAPYLGFILALGFCGLSSEIVNCAAPETGEDTGAVRFPDPTQTSDYKMVPPTF